MAAAMWIQVAELAMWVPIGVAGFAFGRRSAASEISLSDRGPAPEGTPEHLPGEFEIEWPPRTPRGRRPRVHVEPGKSLDDSLTGTFGQRRVEEFIR